MDKICVLLNGPVNNDHRVIKIINTLSKKHMIHLFYVNGKVEDQLLFNDQVELYSIEHKKSLKTKLVQHSFFWREFIFFIPAVLKKGILYNTIWCNDFPTLLPAHKIANKLKASLIYDSHEIYLETLNQFFPVKTSFMKSIVFKISLGLMKTFGKLTEQRLIVKADHIITVNESLANYFKNTYGVKRVNVIMNFPPTKELDPEKFIDFKAIFSFEKNDKILIYQGVLNRGRGLALIINTIKNIPENFKLIILGNGPLKPQLINLTNDLKLNNQVKFIDKVPINDLLNYTSGADYGLNILEDYNLSKKLASPNKLFEYIHAGIPVICSKSIENAKVINKYEIGEMVINNEKDLAETIQSLSKSNTDKYKLACSQASKEYNWERQEASILNLVK
jgi:glycosyltransferase involved in cell wall biosynthesis